MSDTGRVMCGPPEPKKRAYPTYQISAHAPKGSVIKRFASAVARKVAGP